MKWFTIAATTLLLSSLAHAQLRIVTTATDFADIARQIGRDRVRVHSVMKGPENVHNVMASPTEMVELNAADLFVHAGLDTEPWRDNLLNGARNPRVTAGRPGNVDMSAGIVLKDVPQGKLDRSMGDVHAYGNPHYTLNPQNAQRMAVTLLRALVANDPANAAFYKANAKTFVKEIGDIADELRAGFAPYAGLKVITFHRAWAYFADAVPIDITDTIEQQVMITPSAAQVKGVIDRARQAGVKVVICETYDDRDLAQYVADRVGAKMVVLPDHVNGVAGTDTYQALFRHNLRKLIEAANAAGVRPNVPAAPSGGGQ
ncbi:MAG TPA: metal ABC transporter substrate-binding protein [Tepidisphaeraceae bacterium]|jgi:zinc/manganese transport system substrate-binding protein